MGIELLLLMTLDRAESLPKRAELDNVNLMSIVSLVYILCYCATKIQNYVGNGKIFAEKLLNLKLFL